MNTRTTIFALSSGSPPAGIAVVRISGPDAGSALRALTGRNLPQPRLATLATFCVSQDLPLDRGLMLWFPGPASATGEDVAEVHVHGGRAVIAAVLEALAQMPGLLLAEPGAFTRRAFENGRIDFAEAEGLGDLLRAETEVQRRNAVAQAGGALGRLVLAWEQRVVAVAARVEATIDYSDESDVEEASLHDVADVLASIRADIVSRLKDPPAERLVDGIRVAIIGPPNAGKSTLLNALVSRDAAIVSPVAGTTRDVIEVPVILGGLPLIFVDTAGLRDQTGDAIEQIGIARARQQAHIADIVLTLAGEPYDGDAFVLPVHAKSDLGGSADTGLAVSALTGAGMEELSQAIIAAARDLLPPPDLVALNQRHRVELRSAVDALEEAANQGDLLLIAEHLRDARRAFGRVTGGGGVEAMLDALFGQFCVGK